MEDLIDYDSGYLSGGSPYEEAYTRFFIPSEEEPDNEADLRRAILAGEKCWLRNLSEMPDEEEKLVEWKTKFLYQSKGKTKETDMSNKFPVRFYFIAF
jgi:hypothetical protein